LATVQYLNEPFPKTFAGLDCLFLRTCLKKQVRNLMSAFRRALLWSQHAIRTRENREVGELNVAIEGFGQQPGESRRRPRSSRIKVPVPKTPIFIVFSDS